MGSANALPSHGPGNEETSRKWGNPQEARREFSGSPRIIVGAIFDANCELQGSATVFFKQNEPQEMLNSLFSCLESSVKDP